jgi:hypothetical protein
MKQWNKPWIPFLILIVMALVTFYLRKSKKTEGSKNKTEQTERQRNNDQPARDPAGDPGSRGGEGLNRQPASIKYARCRMGCRHIDGDEVNEIIAKGEVNMRKSDMRASPSPRYAVEGRTRDGQQVRIIVAQDGRESVIVTVIDLDTDWPCDCPGDEKKK